MMAKNIVITCAVPAVFCEGSREKRELFFQKELERQIEESYGKLFDYEIVRCDDMGEKVVEVSPTEHRWDWVQRFTICCTSLAGAAG